MPDKAWKRAERTIAEMLNGKRVPVSGRQRGATPDIEHNDFSIEVKHYAKPSGWAFIQDAFDQATLSVVDNQIPMVCIHKKQTPYRDTVVMFRLGEFIERLLDDECRPKTKWSQMDSPVDIPRGKEAEDLLAWYRNRKP